MNISLKLALGVASVLVAGFGSNIMAAEKAETKTAVAGIACENITDESLCSKVNTCGYMKELKKCFTQEGKGDVNDPKRWNTR